MGGAYFADYIPVAVEQDLAEDVACSRKFRRVAVARSRLIGLLREDTLLHGSVCLPDTAAFCSPLFVTPWTDKKDLAAVMPELADRNFDAGCKLTVLMRAKSLPESLLGFVFAGPGRLATPVLQLAPESNQSMESVRDRAKAVQARMMELNEKEPERVHRWYDDAVGAIESPDEFVAALLQPYQAAFDLEEDDPDLAFFRAGWLSMLSAQPRRVALSTPDPSVPDRTTAAFASMLREVRIKGLASPELDKEEREAFGLIAQHLETHASSPRITHGTIQSAIDRVLQELNGTHHISELKVMDHEAGINARTPNRINDLRALTASKRCGGISRILLDVNTSCEDIRSDHFAHQHRAAVARLWHTPLDYSLPRKLYAKVVLRSEYDLPALLGNASLPELRQVTETYVGLLKERFPQLLSEPSQSRALSLSRAANLRTRQALVNRAILKVLVPSPGVGRVLRGTAKNTLVSVGLVGMIDVGIRHGEIGPLVYGGGTVVGVGKSLLTHANEGGRRLTVLRNSVVAKVLRHPELNPHGLSTPPVSARSSASSVSGHT